MSRSDPRTKIKDRVTRSLLKEDKSTRKSYILIGILLQCAGNRSSSPSLKIESLRSRKLEEESPIGQINILTCPC